MIRAPRSARPALALTLLALAALLVAGAQATPAAAATVEVRLGVDSTTLAGTDGEGRVLMFAPSSFQPGSSISHFDPSAFPNLLMEPQASGSLEAGQTDLTRPFFRDLGWPTGSSNVNLIFTDAAGEGFNDPTRGSERRNAIQFVADVWGGLLGSSVRINVSASFADLECSSGSGVLAQAGPQFVFSDFAGAPFGGTWYPGALAESLSGANLSLEDDANPSAADLALTFNERIDSGCLGSGATFFYGLNGAAPAGRISFAAVALHEMAHGLGFTTITNGDTGEQFRGMPDIFSRFLFDNDLGRRWHQMSRSERRDSARNDGRLAWAGDRVTSAAPDFLLPTPALVVERPAEVAGVFRVSVADFGPPLQSVDVAAELVAAEPALACSPLSNPGELAGKIALVTRGECTFVSKARAVQGAGAVGIVIVNNVIGPPVQMTGTNAGDIEIPVAMVSHSDGQRLREALGREEAAGTIAFTESAVSVAEPEGSVRVIVRRTDGGDGETTVEFTTRALTATEGADFEPTSGTLIFEDGSSPRNRRIDVPIVDDGAAEGPETFEVVLTAADGGAALGMPAVVLVTITDAEDGEPVSTFSFAEETFVGSENEGVARVTVVRSGGTGEATVSVTPVPGTADRDTGSLEDPPVTPPGDFAPEVNVLTFAPGETSKTIEIALRMDGEPEREETFRVLLSDPSEGARIGEPDEATVVIVDAESCVDSDGVLCLLDGRFRLSVDWTDFEGGTGIGHRVESGSPDSGLFWFFDDENWELLVKVIEGCPVNDHFWVFSAATTNVGYTLRVVDTTTGELREYSNVLGERADAVTDTGAFACP